MRSRRSPQLKQRLGKALDDRAQQQSIVQDFDVQVAQGQDDADGDGDVTWRNFGVLNGILDLEQRKNRQLGVVAQPQASAGFFFGPTATRGPGRRANASRTRRRATTTGGRTRERGIPRPASTSEAAANPYGVPFADIVDPGTGPRPTAASSSTTAATTSYRHASENLFDTSLGSELVGRRRRLPRARRRQPGHRRASGMAATQGRTRQGLMGVDVVLPQDGKVFLFRGLKAGAPIR